MVLGVGPKVESPQTQRAEISASAEATKRGDAPDKLEPSPKGALVQGVGTVGHVDADGTLRGDVIVKTADDVKKLSASGAKRITGRLIVANTELFHLEGLAKIESAGAVELRGNKRLALLGGLRGLKHVDKDVRIRENAALETTTGLSNLERVGGRLEVAKNGTLSKVEGLEKLDSIGGDLEISDNPSLGDVALPSLRKTGGSVSVSGNPALVAMDAPKLEEVGGRESRGDVSVDDNDRIEKLQLSKLKKVEGNLILSEGRLTDLEGLREVTTVSGSMRVVRQERLESMRGAGSLEVVGADLELSENQALSTLEGLHSLREIRGNLVSLQNPNLPEPAVQDLKTRVAVYGSVISPG
ncbi:MAG: hypothetical protein HY791_26955 [Deltaproteobacteria bacterium]|nr:hypothetical protein [Deltaproteobacteria bacterium]